MQFKINNFPLTSVLPFFQYCDRILTVGNLNSYISRTEGHSTLKFSKVNIQICQILFERKPSKKLPTRMLFYRFRLETTIAQYINNLRRQSCGWINQLIITSFQLDLLFVRSHKAVMMIVVKPCLSKDAKDLGASWTKAVCSGLLHIFA